MCVNNEAVSFPLSGYTIASSFHSRKLVPVILVRSLSLSDPARTSLEIGFATRSAIVKLYLY
jgi:hypothetical protein